MHTLLEAISFHMPFVYDRRFPHGHNNIVDFKPTVLQYIESYFITVHELRCVPGVHITIIYTHLS